MFEVTEILRQTVEVPGTIGLTSCRTWVHAGTMSRFYAPTKRKAQNHLRSKGYKSKDGIQWTHSKIPYLNALVIDHRDVDALYPGEMPFVNKFEIAFRYLTGYEGK